MKFFLLLLSFLGSIFLQAQAADPIIISKKLRWAEAPILHNPTGLQERQILSFEDALYNSKHPTLPMMVERFRVAGQGKLQVRIVNAQFETLDKKAEASDAILSEQLIFHTTIEKERQQYYGKVFFTPIIKKGSRYERLTDIQLEINFIPSPTFASQSRNPEHTYNSVLKDGAIYKIGVEETGIHRIDYNFLKDELKINIDQIDPKTIKLYGNGGGILPEPIATTRYDDLQENAIQIIGEDDGNFDPTDYILFYGEGPHQWSYDAASKTFDRATNIYDNNNYYFIKISSGNGLRIKDQNTMVAPDYTTTSFDDYARLEEDRVNLLDNFSSAQGTGKDWYGDLFETIRERTYSDFSFPNILTTEPASLKVAFAGRSNEATSYNATIDGETYAAQIRRSNTGDIEDEYAHIGTIATSFTPTSEDVTVKIAYPRTASSTGWLDFIQLNVRRQLTFFGGQLLFRDHQTLDFPSSTFQLSNTNNATQIWEVTTPISPTNQLFEATGGTASFGTTTTTLKEFIAFDTDGNFFQPMAIGQLENQNIHEIDQADLIILYPKSFEQEALQLAQHRRDHNGYSVKTVLIDHVYNEFSSGRVDPTAIRDFAKMVHDRSRDFKYLLLFGDGSFDYKNIKNLDNPSSFIPVYETDESLHPIEGFPTDDYYALLSEGEGGNLRGALDIAVGRITVKTPEEAQAVVNKLINYDTNVATLGAWRLQQTFIADDEDGSIHQRQANEIATQVDDRYNSLNINKIFLDAYQQVTTPGGQRYPAAKEAINNSVFKGTLVVNYLGHGGSTSWTQERVLEINDILSWTNFNKLPLFVTATCSFTGYDDANFVTAGENVLLNPRGGGIGLFTTVRAVYSTSNERLTKAVFNNLYEKIDGIHPPIGELMRLGKNSNSSDTTSINARKFTLIGDPSMQLALPKHQVITSKIDNESITTGQIDTIKALQKVTIEGYIADGNNQQLSNFNGKIYITIFDKKTSVSNLGQDSGSRILPFDIQKNALFKGTASVRNGQFQFTFVVPKDINYKYGPGKISYYAENGREDASGDYENIIIGGTNANASADQEGPIVEVYMNDSTFIFGGTTDPNPTLLVLLSDDNGINVAGSSIGHDLTGVLDNNTQNTLQLNDFYESRLDDYTSGTVRFPLKDLAIGTHQIKVKAWDVFNNSSEGFTEFIVAASADAALERVLNYPNPFTTHTEFQFLHNQGAGQPLDVLVRIFTVSGRLVKTIDTSAFSEGNRVSGIAWDGRDDYGSALARGIYLYKISIRTTSGDQTVDSDFEKLVILR